MQVSFIHLQLQAPQTEKLHKERMKDMVVLFPFMAQGHIIPFTALALHLHKTRHDLDIIFVNTPLNIHNLRRRSLQLPFHLLEIPFNSSDHGLPPAVENCDALSYPEVLLLFQASLTLRDPFRSLLRVIIESHGGRRPLAVIGDIHFGWMAGIAEELGVFHAVFCSNGGFGMACYYSVWTDHLPPTQKMETEEAEELLLPDFEEAGEFHKTQFTAMMLAADGTDGWSVFQWKNLPEYAKTGGLLFNTVEEIDELGLMYFKRKLKKPVWAIGPIWLPEENRSPSKGKDKHSTTRECCKKWLDSKPDKSVLYVSFGSMNTISETQMVQLAIALETSGKNFIWVVRPPSEFNINSEFRPSNEILPPGFEERMRRSDRGLLLVQKWAPQVEILSHRAVCVFLSHCGWNSVVESLSNGVPLLGWGLAAEQLFNVKFLVEKIGVCVEVARGKSFKVKVGDLVEKIEVVMGDSGKGKEMKRRASQVKEMMQKAMRDDDDDEEAGNFKGSSVKAMDDFFQTAISFRQQSHLEIIECK